MQKSLIASGDVRAGGGMTGMSTAYWLSKLGKSDVVLLEQRGICGGEKKTLDTRPHLLLDMRAY